MPDAELLVSGKMDRDRLLDAAGCGAEPACDSGPERPAALPAEGGERGFDGCLPDQKILHSEARIAEAAAIAR